MDVLGHYEIDLEDGIVSGWLLPNGEFIYCDWGYHGIAGRCIAEKKGWFDDYQKEKEGRKKKYLIRDYLIERKGCIMLDNPSGNDRTQIMTYNKFKHTKRQVNILFDMFKDSSIMTEYILKEIVK